MSDMNYGSFSDLDKDKVMMNLMQRIKQLEDTLNAVGYDAKAAKKRRFPSKRQESVLHSMTRGMCIETIDPWKENRVRFYHPLLHDPKTKLLKLPFASPVSAMGGHDDCGLTWVPPAGSTLMLFFEGGSRDAPFYIGTTWHRDRGPNGQQLNNVFPSREWDAVYKPDERGLNYMHGPDDGSQCLPPWNTETANAGDITQIKQFSENPDEQKRITYSYIYGFKTPDKHMWKAADGDAKCNRRWKRMEFMSGDGNWMCFKDDHLHAGGTWAHPQCGVSGGDQTLCADLDDKNPYFTNIHGTPKEKGSGCEPNCSGNSKTQCSAILGGHSSTPCEPSTKYCDTNKGTNKFFKNKNECRPYRGPGTPQNNKCDLPQSGIQMLSISGHTFVMDDSVEEPRGRVGWKRSLKDFDYGCNDKYLGRFYIRSSTGHEFMMSDIEEPSKIRSKDNFIRLKTATGNLFMMNDHTVAQQEGAESCPPNYAGEQRGVLIQSTSNHIIKMSDHMNLQCGPPRKNGGTPKSKATKAFLQIRSGYGHEIMMDDKPNQEQTSTQSLQITNPQCHGEGDNCCNPCGPHFLRFQAKCGGPGMVFLRAGGVSVRSTCNEDVVLVGDKEKNPSDKFTYVSKKHIRATEQDDFRYSGKKHIFFAEDQILLMAGRDCPPAAGKKCCGPCLYPVIIGRCPVFCPLTGILHWTEMAMSERVFASGWMAPPCPPTQGCGQSQAGCVEEEETRTFDSGGGSSQSVTTQTQPSGTKVDPNQGATVGSQNPTSSTRTI